MYGLFVYETWGDVMELIESILSKASVSGAFWTDFFS